MQIINQVNELKNSPIRDVIDKRVSEFDSFKFKDNNEIFKELCFCLLTANFSAEGSIKIQNSINDGFLVLREEFLASKLKALGHRFPNARAKFIVEAQKFKDSIKDLIFSFDNDLDRREWLIKNIKGLGYKEASHFLRNIGHNNVAIIDFHIIDLLVKNNLIQPLKNKSLTKTKYMEIENILKKISEKTGMSLGELDLYLWYIETGKVLK